ncbi:MAG: DUF748 domain-containing protein [Alphaproteobacteria bacterium]|uniref:DUF748 domain-containing protein n=1 Tax=Candidatus Nitrobium versatile TaxID=2884831 RepID=A0A953LXL2_9BACT|nr:DUF748 domain-containing protein [Candidatus Nitrobium versatile]
MAFRCRNRWVFLSAAFFVIAALSFLFLILNVNRILKHELEGVLGKDFTVEEISLGLEGVEARNVRLAKGGELFFKVDRLIVRADLIGFLKKKHIISRLVLERPFLRISLNKKGQVENPFEKGKREKGGAFSLVQVPSLVIEEILIREGELFYCDGKVANPPHRARLDSLSLSLKSLSFPLRDEWSPYTLTAGIPGKEKDAHLEWKGRTNFRTLDTDASIVLKQLDITAFKPYFQRKGDADVSRGFLGITMDLRIRDKTVRGPGEAVIRELAFGPGKGLGESVMGIPRGMVIRFLKNHNNEIALHFVIEGKMDDPTFSLAENLTKRLAVGLAQNLGLSVVNAGKSVVELGAKGVGQVGKGIKGIGEGLKKLFD